MSLTTSQLSIINTGYKQARKIVTVGAITYTGICLEDQKSGQIASFEDVGGGKIKVTTIQKHSLKNGDSIIIDSTTNYNSTYTIDEVSQDTRSFEITETFVADDGIGNWNKQRLTSEAIWQVQKIDSASDTIITQSKEGVIYDDYASLTYF